MGIQNFENRKSDFPNRRRLEIVSQTPNEIIADIYREEGNIETEGTPINATTLNAFKEELADWKNLVTTNGTITYVDGNKIGEINFTSDPQSQIENKSNLDASNLTANNIEGWQNKLNNLPNLKIIQDAHPDYNIEAFGSGQATVVSSYLSSDGLTWYRVWSDGWVEQGGFINNRTAIKNITLPYEMANTNYFIFATSSYATSDQTLYQPHYDSKTTTSFKIASYGERGGATNSNGEALSWLVIGIGG